MKRQRLWVLAGVVAAVGLAIYLLITLPAWAYISHTTHTTYNDFNPGSFYLTGMLNQEGGEVALMSIGLAGVWTTPPVTGLMPVFGHASVEHNGYVYVIGGQVGKDIFDNSILTRSVYFAQVNTLTHSLKPFTRTIELPYWLYPDGIYKHAAVVVGDYLYVLSGESAFEEPSDIVVYAKIKPDGTLSGTVETAWNEATFLPAPRGRAPVVELNGFVYVIGGQPESGGTVTDTVWYARPAADGDIAEWLTATGRLPKPVYGPMAATFDRIDYPDLLYAIGGYYKVNITTPIQMPLFDVYFAAPSAATGDIQAGGWISTAIMQNNVLAGAAMEINGQLLTVGGWKNYPAGSIISETNAALLDIYTGQIITFDLGGGNVVAWFEAPAIAPARYYHTAVVGPDQHVYLLGGTSGTDGIPLNQNILCVGATSGVAGTSGYAPKGWYVGPPIDLGRNIKPMFFEWTSLLPTADTQLRLRHRMRSMQGVWGGWSSGIAPATTGLVTTNVPFTQTGLQFQYMVQMTTTKQMSYTPVFQRFWLEYDVVEPPQFWKEASPASGEGVLQNQLITYTIVFTNPNPLSNITAATIEDLLPNGLVYMNLLSVTPGGLSVSYDPVARSLFCHIGTFMAGTSGQISFLTMVSPTAPMGDLMNTVKFRSFEADANAYTHHYVSQLLSPVLTKTADPPSGEPVWGGRQIAYTLTFSNPNNITLDHVVITDRVPANTALVAGSCQPACAVNGNLLQWNLPTLGPLGTGPIRFDVEVAGTVVSGTQILNRGYIAGSVSSANAHTSVAASNAVIHTAKDWLAILDKRASPPSGAQVAPGTLINYTLVYTNNGDAPLQNAQVNDTLPAELKWAGSCSPTCQVAGKKLTWTLGTVNPGQSGQLAFTAQVLGGVDGTLITNKAEFDFGTGSTWSNETSHKLVVPYDLVITKDDGARRAEAGQVLTYTVAYTHLVPQGVVTLTNVIITDDILTPATLGFVSTPGWQVVSSTRRVLNVGTLAPNQSGHINVVVQVVNPLPGDPVLSARNQVVIGHSKKGQGDWNTFNEKYIDSDALRGPDLEISNLHAPARVYQNTPMNIQFKVANEGLAAAIAWNDDGTNNRWMMVEFYAKPAGFVPAGPPSGPKDHVGGLCPDSACVSPRPQEDYLRFVFTPIYPLSPGQSTSLSFEPVFTQLGNYELYLQVDVGDIVIDKDFGRVQEADEYNNIVYVGTFEVEPIKVYLPIVYKQH